DGRAAGGGFEEADAGGPSGADHVAAGDVEGEALGAVEASVLGRGEAGDALDVAWPADGGRVLRAGDGEAAVGPVAGRGEHEVAERREAVVGVGGEVAQIGGDRGGRGGVEVGMDEGIEGAGQGGAEVALDVGERRAAGEGEVEVEAGDEV